MIMKTKIHFESLLQKSEKEIEDLCSRIGVKFDSKMTCVPNVGSSNKKDEKNKLSIDKNKTQPPSLW